MAANNPHGANGVPAAAPQTVQVVRPTFEPMLPGDARELNANGKAADDYVRLEFRPVGGGVGLSMTDDGSIVFQAQFVLPYDQIANPVSRLMLGGPGMQQAVFKWFHEQLGLANPPRFTMCVKRTGVIDPMAGREMLDWNQVAEIDPMASRGVNWDQVAEDLAGLGEMGDDSGDGASDGEIPGGE